MTSQLCQKINARQPEHGHDDIMTQPLPGQVIVMKIWAPQVLTLTKKTSRECQHYSTNFDQNTSKVIYVLVDEDDVDVVAPDELLEAVLDVGNGSV